MAKYSKKDIIISAIAFILVVVATTVFGVLKTLNVIEVDVSPFLIIMTGLTLGFGGYVTGYAIVKKGGYELAVGGILFTIGIILLLVCFKVHFLVIIFVALALVFITIISLFLIKAKHLVFETTDKQEGYVPYMEKLKKEKEEEKAKEEELPEIKSFK